MFYARGSHFETITWLTKAKNRNIISIEFYEGVISKMERLGVKMNNYINTLESNISKSNSFRNHDKS
jgi:four helix bundle protein